MGFYNSKLNKYSKNIALSESQLESTKEKIIDEKKKYLEELKNDIRLTRMTLIDYDFDDLELKQNSCILLENELDFLSVLNTTDFYQHLINLETYRLAKIEDKAFEDMSNNIVSRKKYKSTKTLSGKAYALFGIDKKMVDKLNKTIDDNNLTIDFTQSSRKEWQSILPENQALYIIGRYEIDNKFDFDRDGYENYMYNTFAKSNQNSNNKTETEIEIEK